MSGREEGAAVLAGARRHAGGLAARDGVRRTSRLRLTHAWVRTGGGWVLLDAPAGPPVP